MDGAAHHVLSVGEIDHFNFRSHQIDVRRYDVKIRRGCAQDDILGLSLINDALINAVPNVTWIESNARGCVGLWVGIDDERFVLENG